MSKSLLRSAWASLSAHRLLNSQTYAAIPFLVYGTLILMRNIGINIYGDYLLAIEDFHWLYGYTSFMLPPALPPCVSASVAVTLYHLSSRRLEDVVVLAASSIAFICSPIAIGFMFPTSIASEVVLVTARLSATVSATIVICFALRFLTIRRIKLQDLFLLTALSGVFLLCFSRVNVPDVFMRDGRTLRPIAVGVLLALSSWRLFSVLKNGKACHAELIDRHGIRVVFGLFFASMVQRGGFPVILSNNFDAKLFLVSNAYYLCLILLISVLVVRTSWPRDEETQVSARRDIKVDGEIKVCRAGSPFFGDETWSESIARRYNLEMTMRPRGRPKKLTSLDKETPQITKLVPDTFLSRPNDVDWRGTGKVDWRGTGKNVYNAIDEAFSKTGRSRSTFRVTKWGKDKYGKSHPVEWRHDCGAEVNIDWPHAQNGPDAPHVGWQTGGKRRFGGAARGHIILDEVPVNRPTVR